MIAWIKKIQWGKVILIAFLFTAVDLLLKQVEAIFIPPLEQISKSPSEFFIASTTAVFFTGISLSIMYYYLMEHLPKKQSQRIFFFADVMVATSFVFFIIPVYVLFNVPVILLGSWFLHSFAMLLFSSVIIIKNLSIK